MIKHKIKRFKTSIKQIYNIIKYYLKSDAYIFIHHNINTTDAKKSGAIYKLPYYIEYKDETASVFLSNFQNTIDANEPENVKQRIYAQKVKLN